MLSLSLHVFDDVGEQLNEASYFRFEGFRVFERGGSVELPVDCTH